MADETIELVRYKTGIQERSIPLILAFLCGIGTGLTLVFSGPNLWPWGAVTGVLWGGLSVWSTLVWWFKTHQVIWEEAQRTVTLTAGRGRSLAVEQLTQVVVIPCRRVVLLTAGSQQLSLSLGLMRIETLLARLRALRPELFPQPESLLVLRCSVLPLASMLAMAASLAACALIFLPWQPWFSVFFAINAAWLVVKALVSVPRRFEISASGLGVKSLLTRQKFREPRAIKQDAHVLGGAVLLKMRFDFGTRAVVIDEADLRSPLRPFAPWVMHTLARPTRP